MCHVLVSCMDSAAAHQQLEPYLQKKWHCIPHPSACLSPSAKTHYTQHRNEGRKEPHRSQVVVPAKCIFPAETPVIVKEVCQYRNTKRSPLSGAKGPTCGASGKQRYFTQLFTSPVAGALQSAPQGT